MDVLQRIEQSLEAAITKGMGDDSPPLLQQAVRHAVLIPASRVRPRLCLAVAMACGDDVPAVTDAAAVSLELLHCASLVHDDLPCFDDADTRRGKPSVHRAYGERLAVLAGDGLIVLAFENLAWHTLRHPERLAPLLMIVGRAVGLKDGIVAGQAWECENRVDLGEYHRQKTAALFAAATEAGAAAAGRNPAEWRTLGANLGEAYQVADDLRDVAGNADAIGKPVGQDAVHNRPSAVAELGVDGALDRLVGLIVEAVDSIPSCPGAEKLQALVIGEMQRLLPPPMGEDFMHRLAAARG
ncbi:geranylgeranyl pyrophosphate synthase [Lamprobacter modestohalophilus]|uniref:Geranylgeranyl pyrophosphate synthase n=1 Tax=Lamprobacter modestohalophilus TaxID=1064514 RepID=A0A9X0W966_9GAMM|nr:polyprenyl synthetase family protein [Lamprobacter modestohalophilus]MBK1619206.1 geranylgeranyl pyrophosphate synthase [Lamprobacter modestohalophilus]